MRLEHNFTVAAPVDRAWELLLDLERIVPCMPGATLTSHEDDNFTGTVRVKLGPVLMTFAGKGHFVERDVAAHRMVIKASGRDTKGAGTASATIDATLRPDGDGTAVAVLTDLNISGRVAQFGRGMIADVSARLLGEFTTCLAGQLAPPPATAAAAPPAASTAAPSNAASSTAAPSTAASSTAASSTGAAGAGSPDATAAQPAAAAAQPSTVAAAQPAAAADPQTTSSAVPTPRAPAEPIDLLRVTGASATARRLAPYLLTFLLGAVVGAVLGVWLG